jgi:formamidopyrimidine-DNA glycosylase
MPELPEVETVRRGLNQITLRQEITGGDVLLHRTIAYPFSVSEFLAGVQGCAIAQWHRRGKYLLAELTTSEVEERGRGAGSREQGKQAREHGNREQGGESSPQPPANSPLSSSPQPPANSPLSSSGWLGVHLRMTGQLLWVNPDEPLQKHTRVRLFFTGNRELRFVDQRTFGQMWWVPPGVAVETAMTGLAKLGLDPFVPEFTVDYLGEKFHKRRRPVKTALLDQAIVAGVGNIYADEALFLSGILPETLCADLNKEQIAKLRDAIIEVLQNSIEAGGTTFSNFLNVHGVNGNYGGVAWVYNRAGEPCRVCDTPIQRVRLAGRSSHYCSECQR